MCLTRAATETQKRNRFRVQTDLKGRRIGFKVITERGRLPFQGMKGKLPRSRWINEKKYRDNSDVKSLPFMETKEGQSGQYPTGFHIFVNGTEAVSYVKNSGRQQQLVVETVYFRKVVARGYQNGRRVIVCKEICFIK